MAQSESQPDSPAHRTPNTRRKRYQAPRVLSTEPMEIVAGTCTAPGKGDYGTCPSGPVNS